VREREREKASKQTNRKRSAPSVAFFSYISTKYNVLMVFVYQFTVSVSVCTHYLLQTIIRFVLPCFDAREHLFSLKRERKVSVVIYDFI
jgi:hypothetical protein